MRTKLKICGVCNLEDALSCARAGVAYVGYNLIESSPRFLKPMKAIELANGATATAKAFGIKPCVPVFVVDEHVDHRIAGLLPEGAIVQLHAKVADLKLQQVWKDHGQIWQAVPGSILSAESEQLKRDLVELTKNVSLALYDGPRPGSGTSFDWELLRSVAGPWGLAGGIALENLNLALSFAPDLIDVCSSVELAYRKKDQFKIELFCEKLNTHTRTLG